MKRMILRVVVMLLTFALGIVVDWLILRRAVNTPPPSMVEAVSPAPVAQPVVTAPPVTPLPAATPDPYFILDYDPEMFNPYGTYYMMGPKPKEFANIGSLELAVYGDGDPGNINVVTSYDNDFSDTATAIFVLATERRLIFVTSPNTSGVEYRFDGEFLLTDFMSVNGKNKAVLRGVLTRSKNGRKLVERTVSFRFEYHGC